MIYLDNNATTQPSELVVEAMAITQRTNWANPSSIHRPGQEARRAVDLARLDVAQLLGVKPREITFTSGGTESIDSAIRGVVRATGKRVVVTTPVEHVAIRDLLEDLAREGAESAIEVRTAEVDQYGRVKLESLETLLDDGVALACVQWANNETGAVQPIREVAEVCRHKGVLLHVDATQWIGKMPAVDEADDGPPGDLMTCSPHKFHGPKGVGVLRVRRGVPFRPTQPGSQETGRRGGTENVAGIVGAGIAAREAMEWLARPEERTRLQELRDFFEQELLAANSKAEVMGPTEPGQRLWNTTNIAFPGLEAEAILMLLSERGVCASAGSACSSGSLDPSPVILAMGVDPRIGHGAIRFSLSRHTIEAEIVEAIPIVNEALERLQSSWAG